MKLLRYKDESGNIKYGKIDKESEAIYQSENNLKEKTILSPVSPGKVIGVGLNYRDHAREFDLEIPDEPLLFLKPSTAVIGPEEPILLPGVSKRIDYEGEIAIVIKKEAKEINEDNAADYILGYTCANDVTARDLQKKDGQWTRGKSFDTFSPLGPVIETDIDPTSLKIYTRVNGEKKQDSSTAEMIFSPSYLVSFISRIMTLEMGDVIITGTPPGVGPLEKGDKVEVEIENIGTLTNPVN